MRSFRLAALALIATAALAQPVLTPDQIKSAILYGQSFDSREKYLKKGAKQKTEIDLTPVGMTEMPLTFVGTWDLIAARAAHARRLIKPFTPEDAATVKGNVHAEISISNQSRRGRFDVDRFASESNLVLDIGGKLIQPVTPPVVRTADAAIGKRTVLAFSFDVSPQDIAQPVRVTFVRPKQKPITKSVDLSNLLRVPPPHV